MTVLASKAHLTGWRTTMAEELQEFYSEYLQEVVSTADSQGVFHDAAFVENMTDFLEDQGYVEDCSYLGFIKKERGIKADAWAYNESNGLLTLIVADFRMAASVPTITATEVDRDFKRVEKFWQYARRKDFANALEESTPAYSLVYQLNNNEIEVQRIQMVLVTNALLSERISESILSKRQSEDIKLPVSHEIWDISRLCNIRTSGKSKEDIVIDCREVNQNGIPCLQGATEECGDYRVFLMIFPGEFLANLYDRYGERLLEQNVRTFLQFRGKINKGIKRTILIEPHMFIAYNNGLTVTAEDVTLSDDGGSILSIKNLQIVNGGQTTASLFTTRAQEGMDKLKNVFVQVKLTVIPEDKVEEVVPLISEYANTQNKVSAADFFSNHPFHLRIQEFSRRFIANPANGSLRGSYWYYERTKGQYNNAMARLTKPQIAKFKMTNPKSQMFTKTDLAKFVFSWDKRPTDVSLGAQKCFAKFAKETGDAWSKKDADYNELYFKELIAKAIIFRYLDGEVKKQSWYGGYKANIVTYTIAKFKDVLDAQSLTLNLQNIWDAQAVPENIRRYLLEIAREVNSCIQDTPNPATNVTEWCKTQSCWNNVKSLEILPDFDLVKYCVWADARQSEGRTAASTQRMLNKVEKQKYVIEQGCGYWKALGSFIVDREFSISEKEMNILSLACQFDSTGKIPSDKQSVVLIQLEERMKQEGFFVEKA